VFRDLLEPSQQFSSAIVRRLRKGLSAVRNALRTAERDALPSRRCAFFIVGFPRSGTTLLSVTLDRHTRLAVPPETAFFDDVAPMLSPCSEAALMAVLSRWRRLPELNLDPETVRRQLPRSWTEGDVLEAILRLYANARGKPRWGEKTPQHLRHVPTILRLFPETQIICMLRDGRDAALSLCDMPWGPSGGLEAAATLWKVHVALMEEFERIYSARFTVVRYEAFVREPERVLSEVMTKLGETLEPRQLNSSTPSHVVLPRSMQWKGDAVKPVNERFAYRRRSEASAEDLALLERALGDDLRRCGHGPS
jgi:sulfotransferase family protein